MANTRQIYHRLAANLRRNGIRSLPGLVRANAVHWLRVYIDSRFDKKYGTNTSGITELDELEIGSSNRKHGELYEPTPLRTFSRIIKYLPISREHYAFIDYGSGKGRVLIAASELGLGYVIGVEFARELYLTSVDNIQKYKTKVSPNATIDVHHGDAVDLEIPEKPCIFYLFNPFQAPLVRKILDNIKQSYESCPRPIYVIYYNPIHNELFKNDGCFTRFNQKETVFELGGPMQRRFEIYRTPEAAAAD